MSATLPVAPEPPMPIISPEFKARHAMAVAGLQSALAFSKPHVLTRRTAAIARMRR